MNKKIATWIILTLIIALCLVGGCDDKKEPTSLGAVALEWDSQNYSVNWVAVDKATMYVAKVWAASDLALNRTIYPEDEKDGKLSIDLQSLSDGDYQVEVTVSADGYKSAKSNLAVSIKRSTKEDEQYNEGESITDDIFVDEDGELYLPQELYCKSGDSNDLVIDCAQGVTVNAISAVALDGRYEVNDENNEIIISSEWTRQFSVGAKIALTIDYGTDKSLQTYINFVSELPYTLSGNVITYTKLSGTGFRVRLSEATTTYGVVNKVAIDDVTLNSSYYSLSSTGNTLTMQENPVLKDLSVGKHTLQVFTSRGMSTAILKVRVGLKYEPYDVKIDCDENFPNDKITWRDDADEVQQYIVAIDGENYSSVEYKTRFDGKSFDATGLVGVDSQIQVKAVVNRYTYTSQPVYCYVDATDPVQQEYLSKTYEFLGETHNFYITSESEMKDFLYYYLLHYDQFPSATIEVQGMTNIEKFRQADVYWSLNGQLPTSNWYDTILKYFNTFSEAMSISLNVVKIGEENTNEVSILLWLKTPMVPTNSNTLEDQAYREYEGKQGRYSKVGRDVDFDDWAIDKIDKTASVSTTYELYMAMERGYRPVPKTGSDAERIYEKAKEVLRKIIDDSMDDLDKVRAIYDWLSCNVVYDHKLATDSSNATIGSKEYYELFGNKAFYAEGVFENGLAVCNGIAIAFDILCRIEGIECYKVLGWSGTVSHAWNKVKVGGYWYICDATWASKAVDCGEYYLEYLDEDYLLMDYLTSMPDSKHKENANRSGGSEYYAGDTNYDVYANTIFVDNIAGKVYDTILTARDKSYIDKLLELIVEDIDAGMDIGEYRIGVKCSQAKWNNLYGPAAISICNDKYKVSYSKHYTDDEKGYLTFEKQED